MSQSPSKKWQNPMIFGLDTLDSDPKAHEARVLSDKDETQTSAYTATTDAQEDKQSEPLTEQPAYAKQQTWNQQEFSDWAQGQFNTLSFSQSLNWLGKVRASPWTWLFMAVSSLLIMLLVVDTYLFIGEQFTRNWLLGTLSLALVSLISLAVFWLVRRSWLDIRRLHNITSLQNAGATLLNSQNYGKSTAYVNKITAFYADRIELHQPIERFLKSHNAAHTDAEVCALLSKQVFHGIDAQAYQLVLKHSKETAMLVMISPNALLSSILTLWRTMRMIRDVATLYGGRPGFLSSFSLISAVIQNLLYADVSEMMADSVAEVFGGGIMSVLSAQVAQGMGSGVMTARVGLRAMEACRPLPFHKEERPRLRHIRSEVLTALKGVFSKKAV